MFPSRRSSSFLFLFTLTPLLAQGVTSGSPNPSSPSCPSPLVPAPSGSGCVCPGIKVAVCSGGNNGGNGNNTLSNCQCNCPSGTSLASSGECHCNGQYQYYDRTISPTSNSPNGCSCIPPLINNGNGQCGCGSTGASVSISSSTNTDTNVTTYAYVCKCPVIGQTVVNGQCACGAGLVPVGKGISAYCGCSATNAVQNVTDNSCFCPAPMTQSSPSSACSCPATLIQNPNWSAANPTSSNLQPIPPCVCSGSATPQCNDNGCQCVTCPSGTSLVENRCHCNIAGQLLNPNTNQCACPLGTTLDQVNSVCACPATFEFNSTTSSCQCPANTIYDPTNQNCKACPVNQIVQNGVCACVAPLVSTSATACGCPFSGQISSGTSLAPVCKCPDGQSVVNGACQVCAAGFVVTANGACVCPYPSTNVNGVCQCPSGTLTNQDGSCGCAIPSQIASSSGCACPYGEIQSGATCQCGTGATFVPLTNTSAVGFCHCPFPQIATASGCQCPERSTASSSNVGPACQCNSPFVLVAANASAGANSNSASPTVGASSSTSASTPVPFFCGCGSNTILVSTAAGLTCGCPSPQVLTVDVNNNPVCSCPPGRTASYDSNNALHCLCASPLVESPSGLCVCPNGLVSNFSTGALTCQCPPSMVSLPTGGCGCAPGLTATSDYLCISPPATPPPSTQINCSLPNSCDSTQTINSPNYVCQDGSLGGPVCTVIAKSGDNTLSSGPSSTATCGWAIHSCCPAAAQCCPPPASSSIVPVKSCASVDDSCVSFQCSPKRCDSSTPCGDATRSCIGGLCQPTGTLVANYSGGNGVVNVAQQASRCCVKGSTATCPSGISTTCSGGYCLPDGVSTTASVTTTNNGATVVVALSIDGVSHTASFSASASTNGLSVVSSTVDSTFPAQSYRVGTCTPWPFTNPSTCVSTVSSGCPNTAQCVNSLCVVPPVQSTQQCSGGCSAGGVCVNGQCSLSYFNSSITLSNGSPVPTANGNNACAVDLTTTNGCPSGSACINGACHSRNEPCNGLPASNNAACPSSFSCVYGQCIPNAVLLGNLQGNDTYKSTATQSTISAGVSLDGITKVTVVSDPTQLTGTLSVSTGTSVQVTTSALPPGGAPTAVIGSTSTSSLSPSVMFVPDNVAITTSSTTVAGNSAIVVGNSGAVSHGNVTIVSGSLTHSCDVSAGSTVNIPSLDVTGGPVAFVGKCNVTISATTSNGNSITASGGTTFVGTTDTGAAQVNLASFFDGGSNATFGSQVNGPKDHTSTSGISGTGTAHVNGTLSITGGFISNTVTTVVHNGGTLVANSTTGTTSFSSGNIHIESTGTFIMQTPVDNTYIQNITCDANGVYMVYVHYSETVGSSGVILKSAAGTDWTQFKCNVVLVDIDSNTQIGAVNPNAVMTSTSSAVGRRLLSSTNTPVVGSDSNSGTMYYTVTGANGAMSTLGMSPLVLLGCGVMAWIAAKME